MVAHVIRAAAFFLLIAASPVLAQEVWLQIEARPTEAQARERADAYAARLPAVSGFRLASGWYAIVLGPYGDDEAPGRLLALRREGAVPSDSFVSDGRNFRQRFYGPEAAAAATEAAPAVELVPGEETPEEARRAERALSREERELIQIALRWEGVYNSTIDAAFGAGTRRAMADWQRENGFEATGVLTTDQRRDLLERYLNALRELDMQLVVRDDAGIEMQLPMGLVEFDRIEPPFVHYTPSTDDGVSVLLISQEGDRDTLSALFDVMQTLRIVPLDGPRSLGREEFTLSGENDEIVSYTYARLAGGSVKGFTLIWPAGDEKRRTLALAEMRASFRTNSGALPDVMEGAMQSVDLLSGLEIRRADRARSGVYVDRTGRVLTARETVAGCDRITLDGDVETTVAAEDPDLGLALLAPAEELAPMSVARLEGAPPRLQSEIAVAGYSFGGRLSAPSLTFGHLADTEGLDGDARVQRLTVRAEDGDAGGAVLDPTGAMVGLLLPRETGDRALPADVAFAADGALVIEFLAASGVAEPAAERSGPMAPEDLTALAAEITVLVSCWR